MPPAVSSGYLASSRSSPAVDDVGGALGADVVDQVLPRLGIEMFERIGGRFVVELPDDGGGFARGKVADDLRKLGRMESRKAAFLHG
jgi:hypothetical protein